MAFRSFTSFCLRLSVIVAIILISKGTVQTLSQVAIKQLETNDEGFFGTNSAVKRAQLGEEIPGL